MQPLLLAVMGPTASGKSLLAEKLAVELNAQIISADAFQIYRGLDIGTAKPLNRSGYALLDICDINELFGLGEWLKLARLVLDEASKLGRNVIVAGGTGLYIRALFEEYEDIADKPNVQLRAELNATPIEDLRLRLQRESPEIAAKVDMANPVRVRRALERLQLPVQAKAPSLPFFKLKIALNPDASALEERIRHRTLKMVQNGWIQEVEGLRKRGFTEEDPGFRAIGYCDLCEFLDNRKTLDQSIDQIVTQTRRYAKRQRTWLRSEPQLFDIFDDIGEDALRKAVECVNVALKVRGI